MASILVLNGPNLNLLGSREPDQYGHRSLQEIMEDLDRFAGACGHELTHVQSNSQGALVDAVQMADMFAYWLPPKTPKPQNP